MFRLKIITLLIVVMLLSHTLVMAQQPIPLKVEAAATGQLTAAAPTALYAFNAFESQRMGFIFDAVGDMDITLVVFDQDGQTVLGGSSGSNNNGVIVTFPTQGQYFVGLSAASGTSATYRLLIDADPPLPINAFVMQSYLVAGTSNLCAETTPTAFFAANQDLNVCFVMHLIEKPTEVRVQWWSPSGQIVVEENATFDQSQNLQPFLSGLVFQGTPFETGWWQVHFLIDNELAHIQWVWVQ